MAEEEQTTTVPVLVQTDEEQTDDKDELNATSHARRDMSFGLAILAVCAILMFVPGVFFQLSLWEAQNLLASPLGLLAQGFDKEMAAKAAEVANMVFWLEIGLVVGGVAFVWGYIHRTTG